MSFYKNIQKLKEYSYIDLCHGVFIPVDTVGIAYFYSSNDINERYGHPFKCIENPEQKCTGCIFNKNTGITCTKLCMYRKDKTQVKFLPIEI